MISFLAAFIIGVGTMMQPGANGAGSAPPPPACGSTSCIITESGGLNIITESGGQNIVTEH